MERNVNDLAHKISKLTTEETDKLSSVLTNKYGIYSNIYPYPAGIITTSIDNSTYDVRLSKTGDLRLQLVKRLKEMLDIGLKEAKDILDSTPCIFMTNVSFDKADKFKYELENIGATIEIL